jgi:trimeric autotransporter adhesin
MSLRTAHRPLTCGWHNSPVINEGVLMLKLHWGLAAALASIAVLTFGTSLAGAAKNGAQANVTVRLAASPQPTAVGANLTYTLTVRNWGPQRARDVVVRDRLPAGVTFVSAEASKGACSGTTVVSCSLGALRQGAVAQVKIVVQTTQAGRIVNTANVRSAQRDQARWNNQASLATMVGPAANLGLSLAATPRPATVGQPLTYTLTVRNLSTVDATNVTLTNRIPVRSTLVSVTPSQGSCTGTAPIACALGTVAAGGSAQVSIIVQPTAAGYLTNRASVKSDLRDPYRFNNSRSTTVRARA